MGSPSLENIVEQVKSLSPDEQRQLRDALDRFLTGPNQPLAEDEFEQRLAALGEIRLADAPMPDSSPYRAVKPIEVEGKPVSETIIEERR